MKLDIFLLNKKVDFSQYTLVQYLLYNKSILLHSPIIIIIIIIIIIWLVIIIIIIVIVVVIVVFIIIIKYLLN